VLRFAACLRHALSLVAAAAALHSRQTAMTNLGQLDPKGQMGQIAREGGR